MKRKDRKVRRQRAKTTHGYGSMKKNRGAGNRGGRGMAGTGKRGDAKKPSINPATYFGSKGFRRLRTMPEDKTITLATLERSLDTMEKNKKVENKGGTYEVNLTKLGYDKLLGTGKANFKLNITVKKATDSSIKKIEAAGGKVVLSNVPKEEPKASEAVSA